MIHKILYFQVCEQFTGTWFEKKCNGLSFIANWLENPIEWCEPATYFDKKNIIDTLTCAVNA